MKKKSKVLTICVSALMILTMVTTVALAASDNPTVTVAETPEVSAVSGDTEASATTPTEASATKSKGHRSGGRKDSTRVSVVSVAASVLDMTTDEVKEAVRNAKVGDLLITAGKVDEFKTAYLSAVKTKLDTAVTVGSLTQAQADEKYAEAEAKIAAYNGTTHLCGGTDHRKMFNREKKTDA